MPKAYTQSSPLRTDIAIAEQSEYDRKDEAFYALADEAIRRLQTGAAERLELCQNLYKDHWFKRLSDLESQPPVQYNDPTTLPSAIYATRIHLEAKVDRCFHKMVSILADIVHDKGLTTETDKEVTRLDIIKRWVEIEHIYPEIREFMEAGEDNFHKVVKSSTDLLIQLCESHAVDIHLSAPGNADMGSKLVDPFPHAFWTEQYHKSSYSVCQEEMDSLTIQEQSLPTSNKEQSELQWRMTLRQSGLDLNPSFQEWAKWRLEIGLSVPSFQEINDQKKGLGNQLVWALSPIEELRKCRNRSQTEHDYEFRKTLKNATDKLFLKDLGELLSTHDDIMKECDVLDRQKKSAALMSLTGARLMMCKQRHAEIYLKVPKGKPGTKEKPSPAPTSGFSSQASKSRKVKKSLSQNEADKSNRFIDASTTLNDGSIGNSTYDTVTSTPSTVIKLDKSIVSTPTLLDPGSNSTTTVSSDTLRTPDHSSRQGTSTGLQEDGIARTNVINSASLGEAEPDFSKIDTALSKGASGTVTLERRGRRSK